MPHQRPRRRHPLRQGRGRVALQRVARADQPPDLIQPQPLQRLARQMHMAGMGRIEGPAQQADHLTRRSPGSAHSSIPARFAPDLARKRRRRQGAGNDKRGAGAPLAVGLSGPVS